MYSTKRDVNQSVYKELARNDEGHKLTINNEHDKSETSRPTLCASSHSHNEGFSNNMVENVNSTQQAAVNVGHVSTFNHAFIHKKRSLIVYRMRALLQLAIPSLLTRARHVVVVVVLLDQLTRRSAIVNCTARRLRRETRVLPIGGRCL